MDQRASKLLGLLREGSSDAVRRAAGRQLVDIVGRAPRQAALLIPQVMRPSFARNATSLQTAVEAGCCLQLAEGLASKEWSARTASAECLGLLAELLQHHTSASLAQARAAGSAPAQPARQSTGQLRLAGLPLASVVERGTQLVAAEPLVCKLWKDVLDALTVAHAYGLQAGQNQLGKLPAAERLAKQRQQLKKRCAADSCLRRARSRSCIGETVCAAG